MGHSSLSIYLHIPFCSTKCTYCAFNTYTDRSNLIEDYASALVQEIAIVSKSQPDNTAVDTLFFGGGTPSLLSPKHYEKLFDALYRSFAIGSEAEVSLEANPNDLTLHYLQDLYSVGFNRLSIGMQTTNTKTLHLFDRRHNTQDVIKAVNFARQASFDNVNLDLIFGNPYQTLMDWDSTLTMALSLDPEHFSLYNLELKGGTVLREQVDSNAVPRPDDDLSADMYDLAKERLDKAGYQQYEISNWSKAKYQCQHNLQYWHNREYIGLGAGAHGFVNGFRYSNVLLPERYIDLLKVDNFEREFPLTPGMAKSIQVNRQTEIADTLMMGLRLTQEGIELESFKQRFAIDLATTYKVQIQKFSNFGLLELTDDRLRLTEKGYFLSNAVIRDFI